MKHARRLKNLNFSLGCLMRSWNRAISVSVCLLKAFAHGQGFEVAAAVYVAGKRANQLGNRFPGGKRVSPLWQERGERIAVELAGGSATFKSIFDEEYMKKVCPGY